MVMTLTRDNIALYSAIRLYISLKYSDFNEPVVRSMVPRERTDSAIRLYISLKYSDFNEPVVRSMVPRERTDHTCVYFL